MNICALLTIVSCSLNTAFGVGLSVGIGNRPVPRKLLMDYPLIKGKAARLGAVSVPMIDAPRFVVNNFPKPSFAFQQYPKAQMAYSENQPAPLTISAPLAVPVGNKGDTTAITGEQAEKMGMDRVLRQKAHAHASKRHKQPRSLTMNGANPYLNYGSGYFDIASTGFSKVSQSLVNPGMASMMPFIPRRHAPVPLRLRLRDFEKENFEENLMTRNETRLHDVEVKYLSKLLENEFNSLGEKFKQVSNTFVGSMEQIKEKATQTQMNKIEARKSFMENVVQNFKNEQSKEIKERIARAADVEKLVAGLPGIPETESEKTDKKLLV